MNIITTITAILLLVLVVNPALIAIGQEETITEEETTEEIFEDVSMNDEETSAEETMTEEETTDEELADDTMMMEDEMMTTEIKSPKKQMAEGVEASAVVCNEGLQLIIKTSTGSAACVKSSSVDALIARGWGTTPA